MSLTSTLRIEHRFEALQWIQCGLKRLSKMDFKENKDWQRLHEQYPQEGAGIIKKIWEASDSYKNDYQPDVAKGFAAMKNRMEQQHGAKIVKLSTTKIALRIAASVALILLAAVFFRNQFIKADNETAVITPADGTREINLSDGTVVNLNASSQLVYETEFSQKDRHLELTGEAFFNVKRDESRPFIIETENATVKVLGTSFNVRSYPGEGIFEVYVETGKVLVAFKNSNNSVELTPGEFVRFDSSNNKAVKGQDKSGIAGAWRTGVISFKGQSISEVLSGMQRLYGVKMDLKTNQPADCEQTLTVQKGKLEEAIRALEVSCPKLNFSNKGSEGYVVTGVCCE